MGESVRARKISSKHSSDAVGLVALVIAALLFTGSTVLAVIVDDSAVKVAAIAGAVSIALVVLAILKSYLALHLTMAVFGLLPFASVGLLGLQVPLALALLAGAWTCVALGPKAEGSFLRRATFVAVLGMVVLAAVSYITMRGQFGPADDQEFIKWSIAVSAIILLLLVPRRAFIRTMSTFAVSVVAGALFAILALLAPRGSDLLALLGFFGYQRSEDNQRYYLLDDANVAVRASGSYVDPNIAALFFVTALAIVFVIFAGFARVICVLVLLTALALTLSRGGWLAAIVAGALYLLFARQQVRARVWIVLLLIGAAVVLLVIPVFSSRLLGSFSMLDLGAVDRLDSIGDFVSVMDGHWLVGYGWGRPEFRDAASSYATNMVANAVLATIYRGGLLAVAGYLPLLLLSSIAAARVLRRGQMRVAFIGAGWFGLLVAMQTGYSTAILAPSVLLVSVYVALVVRAGNSEFPVQPDPGSARLEAPTSFIRQTRGHDLSMFAAIRR